MKNIIILLLLVLYINANNSSIEYKANIGIDYKNIKYKAVKVSNKNQKTLEANLELSKYIKEDKIFIKIESIRDFDNTNRRYFKANEFYYKIQKDKYDLIIGKDIKYWGALELNNLTDVYNEKNIQNDAYDKNKKLGTNNITYTYFTKDENELSVIVSEDKNQNNNISSYIKYSGSKDDIAQRDFTYILSSKNKRFLTYHTLIHKDTIYKIEYLYANKNKTYQSGFGFEHTLYNFMAKKDIGLMVEYYKSNNKNVKYQKSIFLASRLKFNDISDSDMIGGIIKDNINDEVSYNFEYNTRLMNKYKIKVNYLKNDSLSSIAFNIAYHF